jgi:radical SAM protein with 4Fe4S-binding SPASM domain
MTNAATATDGLAGEMQSAGISQVVVSLDSFQEHHDRIRGRGSFEAAVSGIRAMVNRRIPLYVTAMVTDENFGSIEAFKKFCLSDLGVSGVRLSPVVPMGRAARSAGEPGLSLSDANFGKVFQAGCPDEEGPSRPAEASEAAQGFKCSAGSRQVFVAADGRVYACHYFQNLGEPLGDLSVETLGHVYRRNLDNGLTSTFDRRSLRECRVCPKYADCLGGCRARAKLLEGGISSPDSVSCRIHGVAVPCGAKAPASSSPRD